MAPSRFLFSKPLADALPIGSLPFGAAGCSSVTTAPVHAGATAAQQQRQNLLLLLQPQLLLQQQLPVPLMPPGTVAADEGCYGNDALSNSKAAPLDVPCNAMPLLLAA
jgi:hypothetical protein